MRATRATMKGKLQAEVRRVSRDRASADRQLYLLSDQSEHSSLVGFAEADPIQGALTPTGHRHGGLFQRGLQQSLQTGVAFDMVSLLQLIPEYPSTTSSTQNRSNPLKMYLQKQQEKVAALNKQSCSALSKGRGSGDYWGPLIEAQTT